MSTYYRPVRRGPRWSVVAAALSCLPLLLALAFLGYRAHDKADDMPTVEHPLACQNLDTDWTLEWSIWRGWYCQPDIGTSLVPDSTPIKVTGPGWDTDMQEDVPGWLLFIDPNDPVDLDWYKVVHIRGAEWLNNPKGMQQILLVRPWVGHSYKLYGPLGVVFTTTQPLDLRT